MQYSGLSIQVLIVWGDGIRYLSVAVFRHPWFCWLEGRGLREDTDLCVLGYYLGQWIR